MRRSTTLNTRVLNQLATHAPRNKPSSPGYARKRPTIALAGDLASAVGAARVGEKLSFRVHGEVRSVPQRGQRPETVVAVQKITRSRR